MRDRRTRAVPGGAVAALTGLLAALVPAAGGCVATEHGEVAAAREAWAACVAAKSESHADCRALQERLRATERRYEEHSRRAWGCDPAQEECPTPR